MQTSDGNSYQFLVAPKRLTEFDEHLFPSGALTRTPSLQPSPIDSRRLLPTDQYRLVEAIPRLPVDEGRQPVFARQSGGFINDLYNRSYDILCKS
jgi:hypothetical protein